MSRGSFLSGFILVLAALIPSPAASESLPQPLTLEDALGFADGAHPVLEVQRAEVEGRWASAAVVLAEDDLEVSVGARLRWVDPSAVAVDQGHDDHAVGLYLSKQLYDFGRGAAREAAAAAAAEAGESLLLGARQARRVDIVRRFLDVLLADLAYARDNEAMAIAFIRFDRLQDRHRLDQVSDVALREAEAEYQRFLTARATSASDQRRTRALLAAALNRPGDLPAELAAPVFTVLERPVPEVETLQQRVAADNPHLLALRAEVTAARQRLVAAEAADGPVLRGQLERVEYSRNTGTADPWRAGITLDVPLYTGGRAKAEVARARAELRRAEADLARQRMETRQAVLDLWLELDTLHRQSEEARAESTFRDLALDRARALYEMEVRADLGDSMSRTTAARHRRRSVEYAMAVAWMRLDALTGAAPEVMEERLLKGVAQ